MSETLYLDTSVFSALFDERWPERQLATQRFWTEILPRFEVFASAIGAIEAAGTPDAQRRKEISEEIRLHPWLWPGQPVHELAEALIAGDLVPAKKIEDAMHLGLAVHYGMDYLVSWNFEHMVAVKTKKRLPVLAAQKGYFKHPLIVSPQEFLGGT